MSTKIKSKLLPLLTLLVIGSVLTLNTLVQATNNSDDCNESFTYTKSSDFSDSRVDINFENSDEQIDVSAKSGYAITEVSLDVEADGFSGFHLYASGAVNNFNPNPGEDIEEAKVKVKKVCSTPTPSPTPTPTPSPSATPSSKINICHSTSSQSNPWEAIQIDSSTLETHLNHGDFLYNGPLKQNGHPDNDGNEWCEENAPRPQGSPSSTPTPTPSTTPTPTPTDCLEQCASGGIEETPSPTPAPSESSSPTPTPTPSPEASDDPTPTPSASSSSNNSDNSSGSSNNNSNSSAQGAVAASTSTGEVLGVSTLASTGSFVSNLTSLFTSIGGLFIISGILNHAKKIKIQV